VDETRRGQRGEPKLESGRGLGTSSPLPRGLSLGPRIIPNHSQPRREHQVEYPNPSAHLHHPDEFKTPNKAESSHHHNAGSRALREAPAQAQRLQISPLVPTPLVRAKCTTPTHPPQVPISSLTCPGLLTRPTGMTTTCSGI